jgi:2'-phosphotransferase
MIKITDPATTAIHGTYLKHWDSILQNGLSRQSRQHIHLAKTLPTDKEPVLSGIRSSCDLFIYIDVAKALAGSLVLYSIETLSLSNLLT